MSIILFTSLNSLKLNNTYQDNPTFQSMNADILRNNNRQLETRNL